jgi:eukaryotic-like serine/threonine-protein kinase
MTAEFNVGQKVGDYEVLSILGLGGMGKVYKVRNVISDRVEAMKVLLPDLTSHQSLADRFLREIRLLASLNHPNIASLRTALTFENQLVMVMEFVEGETLANRIARAPISTADAVNYADQILSALSYAHSHNIIHRDIKPANMMLTPQGVVKLMDFGIARSGTDGSLTSTGTTLGSLNYMPPEQVRGESADARSDIYSFGVSLYELLTGKLPFQGDSQYSLMTAHLNQAPQPPINLRADVPPELNQIILMAMAKNPVDRFQSADAFRNALKSVPVKDLPSAGTTFTPMPRTGAAAAASDETLMGTMAPGARAAGRMATPPATTQAAVRVPTPPAPPTPGKPMVAPTIQMDTPMPPPTMATPAFSGQAAPPPAYVPPSSAARASNRGLWLALGSLIGVGVLIAGGIYIPRRMNTHADPEKATLPAKDPGTKKTNPAAQVIPPGANATTPTPNVPAANPDAGILPPRTPGAAKPVPNNGGTNPQAQTPPPPAAPAGPSPEEIQKMDDMADQLNARASAVTQSVDTLRKQQQAEGYNLRGDMAAAEVRMQADMAKGDAALKAHDLVNAQKYYDMADAEITKLEKFLGR